MLVLVAVPPLVVAGAIAVWARARLVLVQVRGPSMEPTLRGGDRVLVRRARLDAVRPGQIVVAQQPARDEDWRWRPPSRRVNRRKWMVKRAVSVGDGFLVLRGDNPGQSTDSREFGPVPASQLLGVVVAGPFRWRTSPAVPPSRAGTRLAPSHRVTGPARAGDHHLRPKPR